MSKTLLIVVVWMSLVFSHEIRDLNEVVKAPPVEYVSEWAIHLRANVDPKVLEESGFEVVGKIGDFEDFYLVRHKETQTRHLNERSNRFTPSRDVTLYLSSHPSIFWAEQQHLVQHKKRAITDPLFTSQWHLLNTAQFGGVAGMDANVQGAWNAGFNGAGVRIAVVDDGYQVTHPDLAARYQADSSWSYNAPVGNNPSPDVTDDFHGTSAAGVALAANNTVCGVGAAYMAQGAGIRLIAGPVTDATEATALTYKNQQNHIYSNSWGPEDGVPGVQGPGTLMKNAFNSGVVNGRGGLGSIFVWAAGNGGHLGDNCNYDGYANALQVIAVGAVGADGKQSYYSEPCAALVVVAPSNSAISNAGIRTTDLLGTNGYDPSDCTSSFGGTSSACPLVAGVTALILQANPNLSWRDVIVVLAKSATKTDPTDADWKTNAANFNINHKYGFGRVDATAAVNVALAHTVLPAIQLIQSAVTSVAQAIPDFPSTVGATATYTAPANLTVESVLLTVTINHPYAGDLQVILTSPSGTTSLMAVTHNLQLAVAIGTSGYAILPAPYGPPLGYGQDLQSTFLRVSPITACVTPTNCAALAGKLAIVNTGGACLGTVKAKFAQNCGALAVMVLNTDSSNPNQAITLTGSDPTITIPVFSSSYGVGQLITDGGAGAYFYAKTATNSYQNGWTFSSRRLLGESSAGVWTVKVIDGSPANTGTFTSFQLSIYGSGANISTIPTSTDGTATISQPSIGTATGTGVPSNTAGFTAGGMQVLPALMVVALAALVVLFL